MSRIVVMGVAASGKTTVGRKLAAALDHDFLDADDAHPPKNIAKMSAGIPLTDDDRAPWLAHLQRALTGSDRIVVTCSALKRAYRDELRTAGDPSAPVQFVFLDVPQAEIERRIRRRRGHFMKAAMVASQFDALEPPDEVEDDVAVVDASGDHETTQHRVLAAVTGST